MKGNQVSAKFLSSGCASPQSPKTLLMTMPGSKEEALNKCKEHRHGVTDHECACPPGLDAAALPGGLPGREPRAAALRDAAHHPCLARLRRARAVAGHLHTQPGVPQLLPGSLPAGLQLQLLPDHVSSSRPLCCCHCDRTISLLQPAFPLLPLNQIPTTLHNTLSLTHAPAHQPRAIILKQAACACAPRAAGRPVAGHWGPSGDI